MPKLSSSTIKTVHTISEKTKDGSIMKICEHLLSSADDVENAMNVFIEDAQFYAPFQSSELGELLIAISKDVTTKIQYKKPKR